MHSESFVAAISAWVTSVQQRLLLSDWTIHVDADPCDDSFEAEVGRDDFDATLSVGAQFASYDPAKQRAILTHELCHLLLYWYDETAAACSESTAAGARRSATAHLNLVSEQTCERLARVIAPTLPLPKLPVPNQEPLPVPQRLAQPV